MPHHHTHVLRASRRQRNRVFHQDFAAGRALEITMADTLRFTSCGPWQRQADGDYVDMFCDEALPKGAVSLMGSTINVDGELYEVWGIQHQQQLATPLPPRARITLRLRRLRPIDSFVDPTLGPQRAVTDQPRRAYPRR